MKLKIFGKDIIEIEKKSASSITLPSINAMIKELMSESGVTPIDANNAYKRHVWVYACINAIARNIARVPLRVYKKGTDNEITSGMAVQLFQKPNKNTNEYQLKEGIMTYKLMKGEGFLRLLQLGRELMGIEFMSPTDVREVLTKSYDELIGWKWRPFSTEYNLTTDEVFHIQYFNPYYLYRGLSPLKAAMYSLEIDDLARRFDMNTLKNGSSVGGVLETDTGFSKESDKKIKQAWEDRHKGVENAGKVTVLWGGMKYKEMKLTQQEIQYIEQKRMSREEICAIYKVPPVEVGVFEYANYANSGQQVKMFWTKTLLPEMKSLEDSFNNEIFKKYYPDLEIRFDTTVIPELQIDLKEKIDSAEKLNKMGATLYELNYLLDLGLDLEDKEWTKEWWIGMGQVTAKSQMELLENPPEQPKPEKPEDDEEQPENTEEESEKSFKRWLNKQSEEFKTSINYAEEKRRFIIWRNLIMTINPIIYKYRKTLQKYFFELRQEILSNYYDNVQGKTFKKAVEDVVLFDYSEQLKKLKDLSAPYITDGILKGGILAAEEIGAGAFGISSEAGVNFLNSQIGKLYQVLDTVDEAVSIVLEEGFTGGLGTEEIAKELTRKMNIAEGRARSIARTEIGSAANGGRTISMQENGVEKHRWLHSYDEDVRDEHYIDEVVKLGEEFSIGLKFPLDKDGSQSTAANIVNCRCSTIAEIEGAER